MMDIPQSGDKQVLRYDDFIPGCVLGEASEVLDDRMRCGWQATFDAQAADGTGVAAEDASLALVLMMRAYSRAVAPRPPGNVHARQVFSLTALPSSGELVRTVVRCVGKTIKRGRRYVELETVGTGEHGRSLFKGKMTLVWAL